MEVEKLVYLHLFEFNKLWSSKAIRCYQYMFLNEPPTRGFPSDVLVDANGSDAFAAISKSRLQVPSLRVGKARRSQKPSCSFGGIPGVPGWPVNRFLGLLCHWLHSDLTKLACKSPYFFTEDPAKASRIHWWIFHCYMLDYQKVHLTKRFDVQKRERLKNKQFWHHFGRTKSKAKGHADRL